MPLQNMPFWYIDYFELKVVEQQQMQEASLTSLFLPKAGPKTSHAKVFPMYKEEDNVLSPEISGQY